MSTYGVVVVGASLREAQQLAQTVGEGAKLRVVGVAADPYQARDLIVAQRPDIIVLDQQLPGMGGLRFLHKLMVYLPTPTVLLVGSDVGRAEPSEARRAGATEVMVRPRDLLATPGGFGEQLRTRLIAAAGGAPISTKPPSTRPAERPNLLSGEPEKLIVIGASTGGVEALTSILPEFPASTPGIVIVVHMPSTYTRAFARRLNDVCPMEVREAQPKDRVARGKIFLAPGGSMHLTITRFAARYQLSLVEGSPSDIHIPSVDRLFESAARIAGSAAVGLILTGMGSDGAQGMLALRRTGASCFAQDEASCVVFGMPKAALELGAAERAVPLRQLPSVTLSALGSRSAKKTA